MTEGVMVLGGTLHIAGANQLEMVWQEDSEAAWINSAKKQDSNGDVGSTLLVRELDDHETQS